jgi:hypothetical protein
VAALAQAPVDLFATPAIAVTPASRRIYVGGTVNGTVRSAVLYCFEDHIESDGTR